MRSKIVYLIMSLLITFSLTACTIAKTDAYEDYRCVDYNLTWDKSSSTRFARYTDSEDGYQYTYVKIKGESPDDYIGAFASESGFFTTSYRLILASPDMNIDIWKDWSIKEIELQAELSQENKGLGGSYYPEEAKRHTIASSNDNTMIKNTVSLLSNIIETSKPDNYKRLNPIDQHFYLTIYFNETEHIVWEAKIAIWIPNDEELDNIACLNILYSHSNGRIEDKYMFIPSTDPLGKFICDSLQ